MVICRSDNIIRWVGSVSIIEEWTHGLVFAIQPANDLGALILTRTCCTHIIKNSYRTSASGARRLILYKDLRRKDIQVAGLTFQSRLIWWICYDVHTIAPRVLYHIICQHWRKTIVRRHTHSRNPSASCSTASITSFFCQSKCKVAEAGSSEAVRK